MKVTITKATKIKIIESKSLYGAYGKGNGCLKDNYGNLIAIRPDIQYQKLRFGDKRKIIIKSSELPLENATYFHLLIPANTLWNYSDMNFTFPASFIEDRNDINLDNK